MIDRESLPADEALILDDDGILSWSIVDTGYNSRRAAEMALDQADPVAMREEEMKKLEDLHPRDYIVYARSEEHTSELQSH